MSNNWIDQISQQMEHHEVEAPQGVWDGIERQLEAQQPKRRAKLVWAWRAGAAAAVATGLVVGVQMWEKHEKGGTEQVAKTEQQKPITPTTSQGKNVVAQQAMVPSHQEKVLAQQRVAPRQATSLLPSVPPTTTTAPIELQQEENLFAEAEVTLPVTSVATESPTNAEATHTPPPVSVQKDAPLLAETTANDAEEVYVVTVPRGKEGEVAAPQVKRPKRPVSLQLMAMATGDFSMNYDSGIFSEEGYFMPSSSDSLRMESQRRELPVGPARTYRQMENSPLYRQHDFPVKVGLTLRVPLGRRLALDGGLSYARMNSDVTFFTPEGRLESNGKQQVNYLGVPVALTADLWQNRWWNVYASAGGEVAKSVRTAWRTAEGQTIDIAERPWQWSVSAAVGVQLNITPHVGLYAQPSADYYFDNHSMVQTYYTEHPFTPALRMGVRVKL